MTDVDGLAEFQGALVALLAEDLPVEMISRRLREDAAFMPFRDYVGGFEQRMLAVASALVKKWGKPSHPAPQAAQQPFAADQSREQQ